MGHSPLFCVIMKVLTNSDRFHITFPSFFHCSMFKTIFFFRSRVCKKKKMFTNAINLNPCIVFMGEDQRVCMGENVTFWQLIFVACKKSCTINLSRIERACLRMVKDGIAWYSKSITTCSRVSVSWFVRIKLSNYEKKCTILPTVE